MRTSHLYCGTQQQNVIDAYARGRRTNLSGERAHAAKLTAEQVALIRAQWESGAIQQKQLAAQFGVTPATICCLLKGKTWRNPPESVADAKR